MAIDAQKLDDLAAWLAAGAPPQTNFAETVATLGARLRDCGLDFGELDIFRVAINPLLAGKFETWTPGRGTVRVSVTHDQMVSAFYRGSFVEHVVLSGKPATHRYGERPEWDKHPVSVGMIGRGYREYYLTPLPAMHEPDAGLGLATKRAEGFSEAEIAAVTRIRDPLARVVESQTQRENTETLLATYLGREPGARVLGGRIRRGEAEIIPAVILFADLAGYTALSNTRPTGEVVATLNRFFEAVDGPIRRNGGDVLKLIGDGVLAIFAAPDDPAARTEAAARALAAVDAARASLADAPIRFRAALNVGDIHYGNIGSETRLDFTAIGPAVNLAARMLRAAAQLNAPVVCSPDFAALAPDRAGAAETFDFRGFDAPARVHPID